MCLPNPSPPKPPKPPPLEPATPAPAPLAPAPVKVAPPKPLQPQGSTPDLRIGTQKTATRSSRKPVNSASLKSGLNTSDTGGINI